MTREEAIGHIKDVICENNTIKPNIVVFEQEKEALYMAIEALEQEPKFVVKSDGTIEQIKNCNDCLLRKEWEKIGKLLSATLEKQTEQEHILDKIDEIITDALDKSTDQKESQTLRWVLDKISEVQDE